MREKQHGRQPFNCHRAFPVPAALRFEDIEHRLGELVAREDALLLTAPAIEGPEIAIYQSSIDQLPLKRLRMGSVEEVTAFYMDKAHCLFDRHAPALWDLSLIEHPDRDGKLTRTAIAVSDHLISDGRSLHELELVLTAPSAAEPPSRSGRYLDWVRWQRETFPDPAHDSPIRDFWLEHLGGRSPDDVVALPFCNGSATPLSGTIRDVAIELPRSAEAIGAGAAEKMVTPFVVILASVVSALASITTSDFVLRILTDGRPPEWSNTLGWFADTVPVRFFGAGLAEPCAALEAVTDRWFEVLEYQFTPWDYMLAITKPEPRPAGHRPPHIMLNFFPWQTYDPILTTRARPGELAQLIVFVALGDHGKWWLGCTFDPDRFSGQQIPGFLDEVARRLVVLTDE